MNLRERLRGATQCEHIALDAMIGDQNDFASLSGYAGWLQGMHTFHKAIEAALGTQILETYASLTSVTIRTRLLARDLRDLDIPIVDTHQAQLAVDHPADVLGILYVAEGASLGARTLLLKARALGLSETYGARHLTHAANDMQTWRAFVTHLNSFTAMTGDEERITAAASRTFSVAKAHLSSPL